MFSNQSARELSPRLRLDRADGRVEEGVTVWLLWGVEWRGMLGRCG
jgi:hypothetical protein